MESDPDAVDRLADLRRRAEQELDDVAETHPELSAAEVARLLHEVRTYQIELEMQNEDLRRAQVELVESRDCYLDLYDFSPVGYLTLDGKGSILEANLTAAQILGTERHRLLDQRLAAFVASEDQDDLYRFQHALLETRERQTTEMRLSGPPERPRWVRLECVLAEGGECHRIRAVISDVSERRESEEQSRELERQVLRSQKLESLGVLAGGIAHDFNNLLTGILGMAGLALMELPPGSPLASYMRSIERSGRRAEALCRQMLAFAGRETLYVEAVDLSEAVRETVSMLRSAIPQKARLHLDLASDLHVVEADVSMIGQIVMNLVLNAAESLPEGGGEITVSTREVGPESRDAGPPAEGTHGRFVHLVVSDTGCGMDEATRERIFEPFFTTKFTGRGLGLAAVEGIVASHGGDIRMVSAVGRGTTFTLRFPATERRLEARPAPPAPFGATLGGTVLVVDDEPMIRELAKSTLERAGASVLTAADGRAALEMFQEHMAEIDLVLLDVTMPVLGGEEVLCEIRRLRRDLPVVLTSGYAELEVMARIADAEATCFLHKPYLPGELVAMVQEALREHGGGDR